MSDIRQWRGAAEQLRLLGHPVRLALLEELSKAPKCVTDIQDLLEVRQANVSRHLAVLRHAGIVDYHEDGNVRCYYILRPRLVRDLLRFVGGDYPTEYKSAVQIRRAAAKREGQTACRVEKQGSNE
ncbi:MAG: ArsR/SmtB family transcription factor [Planctomycetota bacterium]